MSRIDDVVLGAATSAGADYLVTDDTELQRLEAYQGVTIVSNDDPDLLGLNSGNSYAMLT